MQNECRGVTVFLCIWKGLTLPIASLSCLHRLQALRSKACLSLGVGMTSCTMWLSYLVLLCTTLIFLLMIIPCNNPCGGASVANQETIEIYLFLSRVFCGSGRELQCKRSLLLCHWLSVTVGKSFPLSGGTSCLWKPEEPVSNMKKWLGVEPLV